MHLLLLFFLWQGRCRGRGDLTFYSPLIEKSSCWYSEWAEDGRTHGKSDSTIMLNPLFRATWSTWRIKLGYYITARTYCLDEPADNWLTATQTVGSSQPQKQCNRTRLKKKTREGPSPLDPVPPSPSSYLVHSWHRTRLLSMSLPPPRTLPPSQARMLTSIWEYNQDVWYCVQMCGKNTILHVYIMLLFYNILHCIRLKFPSI